ncbi:MAG: D-alanine--D-alanine ligase [Candidatus Woesearchaeota archaeon]
MEKVVVLHNLVPADAPEDEKDNLVEAEAVSQALSELGYEPIKLPFGLNLEQTTGKLKEHSPPFVFNLVESVDGQLRLSHLAPSLLDHLKIRYTGNSTEATLNTCGKLGSKKMLRLAGLPTAPWMTLEEVLTGKTTFEPLYIIKSVWEHASVGLDEDSVIFDKEKLRPEVEKRRNMAGGLFVEAYIPGREFNISVFAERYKPKVLPIAEMIFHNYPKDKPNVIGYTAKWKENSFEYQHTQRTFDIPRSNQDLVAQLSSLSLHCWELFELNGYARVDFRVDERGQPWILEVNTNPGIAPDAGFTAAAKQYGLDYKQMVERITHNLVIPK